MTFELVLMLFAVLLIAGAAILRLLAAVDRGPRRALAFIFAALMLILIVLLALRYAGA